jgi:hypothetical protein
MIVEQNDKRSVATKLHSSNADDNQIWSLSEDSNNTISIKK